VQTNYVSRIPKAISCSCITITILIFQFLLNHQPISKQSSLKYLGIIFDDKLSWQLQIEKLVTQLSKPWGMLFKLRHYTNISVLKFVYFAFFHSYLTYSILIWIRVNKTTLLPLIRLHNKAVRTLKYDKNKTNAILSTHFKYTRLIQIVSCQIHVLFW